MIIEYSTVDIIEIILITIVFLFGIFVYGLIKGWMDNRRWEKHIYQILEQYRAKYGKDQSCELLMYIKEDNND